MAFPFDIWIDQDLKVMHSRDNCPGLRIPRKYNRVERHVVRDLEQARRLDSEHRACEGCRKDLAHRRTSGGKHYNYKRAKQEEQLL